MDTQLKGFWNNLEGNWTQFRGHVQKQWGKLTDDDLDQIQGQRDILAGKIQERYGETQMNVDRQLDEWARNLRY